ncbi:CHASE2 domain-containing protein [Sphingomonas cavernae]|uniref:CHASE2 domain-containing protein n=1 Tax=Sphingomonas cavernae TaxID=2320861 RepID=UPI0016013801|nr:CHASE2 domain-containing protein [Sphingomonas cavernae]
MTRNKLVRPGSLVSLLNRRRTAIEWVALFLASLGLAALLVVARVADRADNLVYDALSRAVPRAAGEGLIVVAIDNASLAKIGRWPWSRATHAQALERLAEAQPRAVLYDILFVESARDDDARLALAMAKARPVFLPLLLQVPGANGAPFEETLPAPPLAQAMAGAGHVIAHPDDDGVLRRARIETVIGARCWPHLALTAARALTGAAERCGSVASEALVPFAGPAGSYPTVPFSAVLNGEVPRELLAGKIVLVGASASGLGDQYATPMQSRSDLMSGVEFQANLLDALLGTGLRSEAGTGWTLVFTFTPLIILWIGFLYLPPRSNLLLAALLLLLLLAVSGWLLLDHALWIRPAPAIIVMALFLPIWGWRRLAAASRYFVTELGRLREEPGILGLSTPSVAAADRLELQMNLLRDAVRQVRELKHFIEQSQASLPDATLVTNAGGLIALANDRAQQF